MTTEITTYEAGELEALYAAPPAPVHTSPVRTREAFADAVRRGNAIIAARESNNPTPTWRRAQDAQEAFNAGEFEFPEYD